MTLRDSIRNSCDVSETGAKAIMLSVTWLFSIYLFDCLFDYFAVHKKDQDWDTNSTFHCDSSRSCLMAHLLPDLISCFSDTVSVTHLSKRRPCWAARDKIYKHEPRQILQNILDSSSSDCQTWSWGCESEGMQDSLVQLGVQGVDEDQRVHLLLQHLQLGQGEHLARELLFQSWNFRCRFWKWKGENQADGPW